MLGDYIFTDNDSGAVYRQVQFSSTNRDSISITPISGCSWYQNDLYTAGSAGNICRRHNGFSSTLKTSLTITGAIRFTLDNYGNLIMRTTVAGEENDAQKYQGFSTTKSAVITPLTTNNDILGLGWQHHEHLQNLLIADQTANDYKRGIRFNRGTDTTIDPGPTAVPLGIGWNGTANAAVCDGNDVPNTHRLLRGFSATVDASFTVSGKNSVGQCVFQINQPELQRITQA